MTWRPESGAPAPQTASTSYAFETARGADLVLTDGLAVIAD